MPNARCEAIDALAAIQVKPSAKLPSQRWNLVVALFYFIFIFLYHHPFTPQRLRSADNRQATHAG